MTNQLKKYKTNSGYPQHYISAYTACNILECTQTVYTIITRCRNEEIANQPNLDKTLSHLNLELLERLVIIQTANRTKITLCPQRVSIYFFCLQLEVWKVIIGCFLL